MKIALSLVALSLAVCSTAARAETFTFAHGDVVASLHETPCINEKVNVLLREPALFKAADILWQGEPFAACWTVVSSQVVVVDETGEAGYLSLEGFQGDRNPVSAAMIL
jgi:hypothetical protein